MLFNSYEFIFLFLPLSLLGYMAIWKYGSRRISLVWLIAASLFFYAWWNPAYLGLILGSMFFNYSIGILLSGRAATSKRKIIFVMGVIANILLLVYYKYANFFVDNINYIANVNWNVENILLPLAISFFTFQQITYLVDAYRGDTREYNFIQYALFVSFFPQLIAGPIVHHREMMPQFAKKEGFEINYEYIAVGLSIFFLGLFKKVAIADTLSPYSIEVFSAFSNGDVLSLFETWKGVLAYTFQLYFDFSGYSDMAIGIAFMFGIRLPLNFNSPYKSLSIIEFWQRWHITLSRFLKDYIYIPLGGNRKGWLRRYVNLMLTMLIGGLWHGAGWTFVIWGALHGGYLIINHMWRALKNMLQINPLPNIWNTFVSHLITFLVVSMAWVYFRADSIDTANSMIKGLFGYGGVIWPEDSRYQLGLFADIFESWGMRFQQLAYFNGMDHTILMVVLLLVVWFMPNIHQVFNNSPAALGVAGRSNIVWKPNYKWLVIVIISAVISILKLGEITEFLYFKF